jgi:hypothetical protein
VTLASTDYHVLEVPFDVIINPATCDCSLLDWDAPAAQQLVTTRLKEVADSITIDHYLVNEDSKSTYPAIRSCYRTDLGPATPCDETTVITDVKVSVPQGDNLPYFLEWTAPSDVITVNSIVDTEELTWDMVITHSTVDEGDLVITTLSIVIDPCVITDIDLPDQPTTKEYLIFATSDLVINMDTPGFQQRPACGYALTEVFSWNVPATAPITVSNDVDPYILTVSSTDPAHRNVYPVELALSARYEVTGVLYSNLIQFDVTVTDPCQTTVMAPWVINDITIESGLIDEQLFNRITDSAADAVSDASICGTRTYEVVEDIMNDGTETEQTFIFIDTIVDGAEYKMRTHSEDEDAEVGVHNMVFRVTLPDATYPVLRITFQVDIQVPTCDCTLLLWDPPTAENFSTTVLKIPSDEFTITMGTANEDSKSDNP